MLVAGLRERVRGSGPPQLRVLRAWSVFVVGGIGFQKTAEHWQAVVPAGDRGVPAVAFGAVVVAAAVGSVAVLAGVAIAAPAFVRDLRGGGWPALRRPVAAASAVTALGLGALVALVLHRDVVAAAAFVAFALCSLVAWTHAAMVAARRLPLRRLHGYLAVVVAAATVAMTAAAAVWFAAVSAHAPSFVGPAQLAATATLMLAGAALAVGGARRSLRS